MANADSETIGNISAIALPPHGRGIKKRGSEQIETIPSIIINHPIVFSDDLLRTVPIGNKDKTINKKKVIDTMVWGSPVVSGNTPMPHRTNMSRINSSVPIRPKRVPSIRVLLMAVANTNPIIPDIISPTLKTTEAIPRAAQIGFSPAKPPISLSQLSVQLNHGEFEIAKAMHVKATIGPSTPHNPATFNNICCFELVISPLLNNIILNPSSNQCKKIIYMFPLSKTCKHICFSIPFYPLSNQKVLIFT